MNARRMLGIAGLITLTLVGSAYALEESTASLTPYNAQMKTVTDLVALPDGVFVEGFSPTTVYCPSRTCTLRFEVTGHFAGQDANADARAKAVWVEVDGSTDGILPTYLPFFAGHTGNVGGAHTFTFMKEGLSKGHHTVNVSYAAVLNPGSSVVYVAHRILTIQLFTP